ncbi:MAG: DUF624 domain-containing protein [Clostridia bacterium]|nr:DUF624 domain-containing protein [Clostridia bacterium]
MAGFFGFFDYTKPGPGIPKDAPPKHPVIVFFEIYSRKFWNLVKLNILFSIFNLPAIATMAFLVIISQMSFSSVAGDDLLMDFVLRFILGSFLLCIPLVTVGPAQAGFTFVLRNYAREEHAFIWSDFKEHALKNFKESVIISVIDLIVAIIIAIDLRIYMTMQKGNFLITIASAMLVLSFIIYLMMHMYIYPMLVTFKLGIKQIYKNALIFAVIRFLPNLGILVLCAAVLMASFIYPFIGMMLFPLITVSTIGLITNFYVYPALKKHIIDRVRLDNAEGSDEGQA